MRRFGIKMGPARNKEWTCCFGLHVRTATIMIGVWHLVSYYLNYSRKKKFPFTNNPPQKDLSVKFFFS